MNWDQAISAYKSYLQIERGLSKNAVESYIFDVQKLQKSVSSNPKSLPITIDKDTVLEGVYESIKPLSERSQARFISGLKSFFNYLVFEKYRPDNPMEMVESPRLGRKLPPVLSTQEIDALIAAIDRSSLEGQRNVAILETLYGCGLRVSELTKLKISDLFFDEGFIKVNGKGNKQRFVPVGGSTIKYITSYVNLIRVHYAVQKGHEDTLFLNRRGKQLTRAMIFTIVKKLGEKAKIQKSISPHTFRHSFATHLLQNNADLRSIQMMLGHESITTTEIYVHLDKSHLSKIVEKYHPRK